MPSKGQVNNGWYFKGEDIEKDKATGCRSQLRKCTIKKT